MPNTALTDLITLLQASNSNSEPVIQGKGPVLQQTGSGVINVPQQAQQKQKTPLEQAGDAIKVAKAYQDLQNTNSNSLSNIRFNAPEPDTSSYLSDAFANSNFEEQAPIFTGSADGALAMNAPQFNSDINYSNGFNYEPVASTPDTPEETQVITQQATPEQNNPAQDNSNTIMSASGIPLPSNESLEKEYQNNIVTIPMTGSGNSDAEANADLLAKRYASDYQNKKAASVLREKQESRDYLMTHGIDEQGKYFELDSQGNKKYPWQPGTIRRGLEKVKKATAALGVATALTSPTVASAANPQDTGSVQTEQQGAVSDAGKAVTAQQQQTSTDNGALSNAGTTSSNDSLEDMLKKVPIPAQNEYAALHDLRNQLVNQGAIASNAQLQQTVQAIQQAVHNLDENFNNQAISVGTGEDFGFIVQNPSAGASTVAKYIAKQKGQENDPSFISSMSTMIDKYAKDYPSLPKAVVGMVIRNNLTSTASNEYFTREDKFSNNYDYKNPWFSDPIKETLDKLADKSNENSYENLKDRFYDVERIVKKLQPVNTQINIAQNSINRYLADVTKWGEDTTVPIFKKWITKNKETARKDSIALLTTALEAMEMVGNQYNYTQRNPSNINTSNNKQ